MIAADPQHRSGRPLVIMLVGPTAVGKTEVALKLAVAFNGEIVSADSRLFYRGMDIGTAKPSEEARARVPHHLIDIVNPDETLSLAEFQELAQDAIVGIVARGRLPFFVGGTGQYVQAVRSGWSPPLVPPQDSLRAELSRLAAARGTAWLHERLAAVDPIAAGRIDPRNLRRTVRALEVILVTGRRFSAQRTSGEAPYQLVTLGLRRSRPELYARIDARIEEMLARGLLDETKLLLQKGYSPKLPAFSAIGYSQCAQVIGGAMDLQEARTQMRRSTRALVRRQSSWFKESDPTILWCDAARPDLIEAITALLNDTLAMNNLAGQGRRGP
jgi:tRNA dimethylallyltransferase